MTDRTCSTCKHWTRHPWPNRLGWHDTGTCTTLRVTPAHTISERDMFPMLDTHRDFGCVKWDGDAPLLGEAPEISMPRFEIDPEALARFELATKWMKEAVDKWEGKQDG